MKGWVGIWLIATIGPLSAHSAPSGWEYPLECCSNKDCREVDSTVLEALPEGYFIPANGDTVKYRGDKRLRPSPDGHYHLCTAGGRPDGYTYCLFVPSGS